MSGAREIRRLRYLQAMGVPAFVARRVLPGAAPTRRLMLRNPPAVAAPPLTRELSRDQSRKPAAVAAPAAESTRKAAAIRETLQPGATPRPEKNLSPPAAAVTTSRAPDLRFSLAAIRCAGRLWIEELEDALLAQEQVQLIGAIARALVHPEPLPAAPVVTQFDWPLHGNQQLDLGPGEARATLQGFLQRQLEDHGCVELLCLGDAAAERLRDLRLPCALRHLPGSRAVLDNPAQKRELWAALRA